MRDARILYNTNIVGRTVDVAMAVNLPGRSYCDALEMLKCHRLDIRRNELCEKTMKKIA